MARQDNAPINPAPDTVARPRMAWHQAIQSLPKQWIYLMLIAVCTIPQFFTVPLPNEPDDYSKALYRRLMALTPEDKVLVASDWTNSTRGESRGEFITMLKVLMERNVKFAMYSTADPQAPQAALDTIAILNAERKAAGKKEYIRGQDFTNVGYFPDSEAATNGIANDLRSTFSSKKDLGVPVMNTPPLKGVRRVQDIKLLIVVTASKTSNFTVERVYGKAPLAFMVTGVMGPETQVFYQSGQIVGLANGLKGVFDMEQLIAKGTGDVPAAIPNDPPGQGAKFYPTLHFAMALLVIMIVLGNIGTIAGRRGARNR